MCIYSL